MRLKLKLIASALKMFVRQKEAIIWTVLLPLFMVFLFSFVKFDGLGTISMGLVNNSSDTTLVSSLRSIQAFKTTTGTVAGELDALKRGDRSVVLVVPERFEPTQHDSLTLYVNAERPQETRVAQMIINRTLDELVFKQHTDIARATIHTEVVNSRNLTYIDFLLPGILAMAIMQAGVFGVAFGFVILKKRGILRRMLVTPMSPSDFIISQVTARVIILMLQVLIMIGAGVFVFHLHFIGNIFNMIIVGVLGGIIFLSIGFALSGISKSEDQVAPLANLVSLPMMMLSGVFFSRSNLPGFAHTITNYFPLTYLADGLRSIAIDGAGLGDIVPQLIGLAVWCVITVFIAIKAFRWE
ncbi:MAG TPA: ABC transporter permease [Bacteroidota bacterium]|nr:ABC transporter permease [Bacteroidota bacterium]